MISLKGSRNEIRQEIVEITKDRIIEPINKKGIRMANNMGFLKF